MKIFLINFLIIISLATSSVVAQIEVRSIVNSQRVDSLSTLKMAEEKENLSNAEEIFLQFTYSGLVNSTIIAYYYKNEIFFPFKEVCNTLEIVSNIEDYKITGFLNDKLNSYTITFNPNKAKIGHKVITFNDYLKTDFDFYFNADFYQELFGLELKTNFSTLTVSVRSKEMMPIFYRFQREKQHDNFAKMKEKLMPKIMFPRERKIFGGGIFDYNFGYNIGQNQNLNGFYNFRFGAEVLGGDFNISNSGDISAKYGNYSNTNYLWRYVFDKNKYLRTVSVGNISSNGLYSINYKGIRISNDQVEPRRTFATHRIYDKTNANWSVEIYISNQLIAVTKADAVGDYYFDIPLSYGTTLLQMKYFGPGGEYYEESRLFQTPFYLLRPKEFIYFVDFGSIDNTDSDIGSIKGGYGVTEWLTTEFGYQYLENNVAENIIFNSTTARFLGEYLLNLTLAPQAYYKLAASVLYFSQTSLGFEYTKFTNDGFLNPSKMDDDFGANFFVPFRFPYAQLNIKGSFDFAKNDKTKLYDYSLGTTGSLDGFNPSLTYRYIKSVSNNSTVDKKYLDFGLSYFLSSTFGLSSILAGNLVTFRTYYDTEKSQFENYTISFATTIKRDARLQITHSRNLITSDNTLQIQLIVYLRTIQANTSLATNGFRIGALGSVSYDMVNNEIRGFNRAQVGRSSAVFRFYIDSNGNNKYDVDEEELIEGANIIMGTSVIEKEKNGIIRARELDPYTIYSVDIDETSIRNPLLVPGVKRFSFVADPNTVKHIEIPFYIAGEIDGTVKRKVGNGFNSVAGIKVHIKNLEDNKVETVTTFSDGTYYYFGLRPGNYIAYIDKEQLKILGIKKDMNPFEFEVKPKENGDIIMNADFIIE